MAPENFASLLTCIDGRIQRPVNDFLMTRFGVPFIDTISRAGIVKHLGSSYDPATRAIVDDLDSSVAAHKSTQLAIVAHHDCAGNPVDDDIQHAQLTEAVAHFMRRYPELSVIGMWVGDGWTVEVIH